MITKKLAGPLINEKILSQAQHCYIATSAITDAGFDFIRSRIPTNCKMSIVTSLDGTTSPYALQRILRHYQGRITLNIFTRNVLHANLYVFDLPYRKSIAFVGSGSLSLEGLKDQEELFWKITDAKEIESLLSWYTSYFEFGVPLTESLLKEYEKVYPAIRQREIDSQREKDLAIRISQFSFEGIKFRSQYFKKEDYTGFRNVDSNEFVDRLNKVFAMIQEKSAAIPPHSEIFEEENYKGIKIHERTENIFLHFGLRPTQLIMGMVIGMNRDHRQKLTYHLENENTRQSLFNEMTKLDPAFILEVGGIKKPIGSLANEKALQEFLQNDVGMHFTIRIEKAIGPGDHTISESTIVDTLTKDLVGLKSILQVLQTD